MNMSSKFKSQLTFN